MQHPTFSSTPFFYDRDKDRASYSGKSDQQYEGQSWRPGSFNIGNHSSPRVSYYFPKGVGEYHFGERHPMKPHRLTLTNHLVIGYGLHKKMDMYQPRNATKDELETFHDEDYIDFLSRVTPNNVREFTDVLSRFNVGDDCPIFGDMFDYCKQYAGASLMAGRKIVEGTTDIAINWTGGLHHAKKSEASGFCYVNDIVLAILELLRVHARVLYIDIDIHHGDGVQEAFYNSNRVLTVSFHKYFNDFFPGTGHIDEVGHSLGKYFSLNVPLQDGIDNESYVALFKAIMEPTITTFQPSAIVLQCGADSLGCDRLGCFNLSISAHGECVRFIKAFGLPLIVLGGGGYTIKNVSRCWTYETAVILDLHQDLPNSLPHTAYDDFFAPDWKLHPDLVAGRTRFENLNTKQGLEKIRIGILERLRYMHGAPSVGMVEIPPSLAPWLIEEEKEAEEADEKAGIRRDEHRANNDWFENDGDGEFLSFAESAAASGNIPTSMVPGYNHLGEREKRGAAISASAAMRSSSNGNAAFEKSINAPVATPRPRPRPAANSTGRSAGGGGGGSVGRRKKVVSSTSTPASTSKSVGKPPRNSVTTPAPAPAPLPTPSLTLASTPAQIPAPVRPTTFILSSLPALPLFGALPALPSLPCLPIAESVDITTPRLPIVELLADTTMIDSNGMEQVPPKVIETTGVMTGTTESRSLTEMDSTTTDSTDLINPTREGMDSTSTDLIRTEGVVAARADDTTMSSIAEDAAMLLAIMKDGM